ncbi:hypothetical protein HC928_20740 [bacterium]|nr:hypothetical protein [bacterium]
MELKLVVDTRVGSAEFGDYHYTELLKWAFGDRKSKAALLRDIGVARIDANQDLINRKIDYYINLYQKTEEELVERIRQADEEGISIAKLHQTLADEAGLNPKKNKLAND